MTEFIVIRHGETDWNRQHRFQGQIDVPLNDTGLAQAQRLALRLQHEPMDLLVCSDLQRAQATAEAVARARAPSTGPVPMLPLAPLRQPLWREQAFGVLEGLDVPTICSQHPELWDRWTRHDADYALPGGGESNRAFHARVMQALHELAQLAAQHRSQRLVVFSHGGVLDMLWRTARGQSLSGPRECDIPNTGINRLRWANGQLHIVSWAEADHLQGLPAQPSTAQTRRHDLPPTATPEVACDLPANTPEVACVPQPLSAG